MYSIRGLISALVLAVLGFGVVACSGGSSGEKTGGGGAQPSGQQILQQAATAMQGLKSVGIVLGTEGTPPVPVKSGDVKLLKSGDAQGKLQIQQFGLTVETDFVLVGDSLYYKGLTGSDYQKTNKSLITNYYDPSAVLDPQKGIAKLLTVVSGPQVEGKEKVNGKEAYKVRGTLPKNSVAGLIPGVNQDVNGHVWVAVDGSRLVRVRAALPPANGDDGGKSAVIIDFTEFDAAYKIQAPA